MNSSMLPLFSFEDKCALVSGATGSFGHGFAEALRDATAHVAVVGRSERILDLAQEGFPRLRADLAELGQP